MYVINALSEAPAVKGMAVMLGMLWVEYGIEPAGNIGDSLYVLSVLGENNELDSVPLCPSYLTHEPAAVVAKVGAELGKIFLRVNAHGMVGNEGVVAHKKLLADYLDSMLSAVGFDVVVLALFLAGIFKYSSYHVLTSQNGRSSSFMSMGVNSLS